MAEHDAFDQRSLADMRTSIDNIDAAIVNMLAERFRCTRRIGQYKAQRNMPPTDLARERHQTSRLRKLALEAQLDPDFAEHFLAFVVKEVIRHHKLARG
jgi:chorismate mutase